MDVQDLQGLFSTVIGKGKVVEIHTYHPSKFSTITDYGILFEGARYAFRVVDGEVWEVRIITLDKE